MRTLPLVIALVLALAADASAAPKRKPKNESPPTAQPDATLVLPDTTPPPPTTAAPTRPVAAQPLAAVGAAPTPTAAVPTGPAVSPAAPAPPQAPPPPPPLPPQPAVLARAELCLRTEAPRAAKAEASVKLATDLLLENLCAAEVERAALYTHNAEALARFTPQSERSSAGLAAARVDPESGEIVNPPAGDVAGALSSGGFGPGDLTPPAAIRKFAAELVLEAKAALQPRSPEPKKGH